MTKLEEKIFKVLYTAPLFNLSMRDKQRLMCTPQYTVAKKIARIVESNLKDAWQDGFSEANQRFDNEMSSEYKIIDQSAVDSLKLKWFKAKVIV